MKVLSLPPSRSIVSEDSPHRPVAPTIATGSMAQRVSRQAAPFRVHDSVAENEQQECINKAKALVRAAEEAVRFATRKPRSSDSGNGGEWA